MIYPKLLILIDADEGGLYNESKHIELCTAEAMK